MDKELKPFGETHFEAEKRILGESWDDYFFEHTKFVSSALKREIYLIVGRRGSGKSSLTEYFRFQDKYRNSEVLKFDEAENCYIRITQMLNKLELDLSNQHIVREIYRLWRYIIGRIIIEFYGLSHESPVNIESFTSRKPRIVLNNLITAITKYCTKNSMDLSELITEEVEDEIKEEIEKVFKKKKRKTLFLIFDSQEKYDVNNTQEMAITAALIQAAYYINANYSYEKIHIKICVSGEVYPYVCEEYISNPAKYIKDPLFLQWKPKDLIRLICWRYFKYLKKHDYTGRFEDEIDWDKYEDIYDKIWEKYFDETLINGRGIGERTLPYILRHTQLKPRQLVMICNEIAKVSKDKGIFPRFNAETIRQGIYDCEVDLADDLLNSYSAIYINISRIIDAIAGQPIQFLGRELDAMAHRTASEWKHKEYESSDFKKMVIELGIIGRCRGASNTNPILKADFEFHKKGRLYVNERDNCVIHPMFYRKLNITKVDRNIKCVYPFPDHPDYNDILED